MVFGLLLIIWSVLIMPRLRWPRDCIYIMQLLINTSCHLNIIIHGEIVDVSINDTLYFNIVIINDAYPSGSLGIGTRYYKVMFDNIYVEPK